MTQLITFRAEKLNLDYLTFNILNSRERILEFAAIFHSHKFNSNVFDVATDKSKIILEDKSFKHTLTFRLENDSWNKETVFIHFAGKNSRRIYFLITNGYFSISQLNCKNLKVGRIDIRFIRQNQRNDTDLGEFLEKSKETFKNTHP
jgi:hypothetical protein